jgi:alpha-D-ribose 1-methylphosphonate 5-triphosphate diphosphatase
MHIIRNARIVTADEQFTGSMAFADGIITGISCGNDMLRGEDWEGDYLLPGMIELHTDNLERHLSPLPQVSWPVMPAIVAHDAQIAAAGITTVLDALSIGDIDADSARHRSLHAFAQGLADADDAGILRADHFLHLRLELSEENLLRWFEPFLYDERLKLVSMMDHTPGQRQWADLNHYRAYISGRRGWSEEKVESLLETLLERQQSYSASNRRDVVERCARRTWPIPLATHDDTTVDHIAEGVMDGVSISEFPTTMAAAQAARNNGLGIVMGAPNVVRGGSHLGNVGAAELARADLLDVLSSDYAPASLLQAAFMLQLDGYGLPDAVATVTRNPALMIGLVDRGEIAPELRADFIRVRMFNDVPIILETWNAGQRIA